MVQGTLTHEARWVFRALWLIAAALGVGILTVRSNGILDESQRVSASFQKAGTSAFAAPLAGRHVPESLDSVAWTDHRPVPIRPGAPVRVTAGSLVTITGWAFDPASDAPFSGLGARVDDQSQTFAGIVKRSRPDVAAALRDSRATDSGFSVNVDTSALPLGHHVVTLRGLTSDEQAAVALGTVDLILQPHALAAQNTDVIDAVNGVIVNSAASLAAPVGILRSTPSLNVSGWGFVTDGRRLASSVTMLVDGTAVGTGRYGISRVDVARAYHDVRVTRCGFEGSVPLTALTPGQHEIGFQLNLSDGIEVDSASTLRINIQ